MPTDSGTTEMFETSAARPVEAESRSGASPMSCYPVRQVHRGCPVAGRADIKPHELVRLVQIGQRGAVLASRCIWECTSCQTCVTRCPQKVDIAAHERRAARA